MSTFQKFSIVLLRISLGWLFFWAGITKILDPKWTSAGYIKSAKLFPEMYNFFLQPKVLPWVDLLNEWGLTLLGVSLILGILVRLTAPLGALLMLLYYLAQGFPYPNEHSLVVDEHIVYIGALLTLAAAHAGRIWGLDERFS